VAPVALRRLQIALLMPAERTPQGIVLTSRPAILRTSMLTSAAIAIPLASLYQIALVVVRIVRTN